jgi:ribosomal protein S25
MFRLPRPISRSQWNGIGEWFVEKVRDYIIKRKTPVSIQQIMHRFHVSQSYAYKVVNSLLSEGKVRRVIKYKKSFFQSKSTTDQRRRNKSSGGKVLFQLPDLEEIRSRLANSQK